MNADAFGYGYFTGDVVLGTTVTGFGFIIRYCFKGDGTGSCINIKGCCVSSA